MRESLRLVPVVRPAQGNSPSFLRVEMRNKRTVVPFGSWGVAMPAIADWVVKLREHAAKGDLRVDAEGVGIDFLSIDRFEDGLAKVLRIPDVYPEEINLHFEKEISSPEFTVSALFRRASARGFDPNTRTGSVLTFQDGTMYRLLPQMVGFLDALNRILLVPPSRERRDAYWRLLEESLGEDAMPLVRQRSLRLRQASAMDCWLVPDAEGGMIPSPKLIRADGELLLRGKGDKAIIDHVDDPRFSKVRPTCVYGENVVMLGERLQELLGEAKVVRQLPAKDRQLEAFLSTGNGISLVAEDRFASQVVSYDVWRKPKIALGIRPRSATPPEWLFANAGNDVITLRPDTAASIMDDVLDAEQAGQGTVLIGTETFPIAVARAVADAIEGQIAPFRERLASSRFALGGNGGAPDLTEDDEDWASKPDKLPKALEVAERMGLVSRTNYFDVQFEATLRPATPELLEVDPYDVMKGYLRTEAKAHQIAASRWAATSYANGETGSLFCDEQGLGKSLAMLMFIVWIVRHVRPGKPVLLVVPFDLRNVWQAEAEKHLTSQALGRPYEAMGRPFSDANTSHQTSYFKRLQEYGWVITTQQNFISQHVNFAQVDFAAIIFDEAQAMKNPGTWIRNAAYAAKSDFKVCVTGTPVENRIEEAWSLCDLVRPGHYGSLKSLLSEAYDGGVLSIDYVRDLSDRLMRPSDGMAAIWRNTKNDILTGLPAKDRIVQHLMMPAVQEAAYGMGLAKIARRRLQGRASALWAYRLLNDLSLHPLPHDALPMEPTRAEAIAWLHASARTAYAYKVILLCRERGVKTLVAINSVPFQALFSRAIRAALGLKEGLRTLNGDMRYEERTISLDRFREEDDQLALLLTSKVGGVGHTITEATCVIHLTRWPNPAVEAQVEDRTHRIGQDKVVQVHVPLAVYGPAPENSIDLKLEAMMTRKRNMSDGLLMPSHLGDEIEIMVDEFLRAA